MLGWRATYVGKRRSGRDKSVEVGSEGRCLAPRPGVTGDIRNYPLEHDKFPRRKRAEEDVLWEVGVGSSARGQLIRQSILQDCYNLNKYFSPNHSLTARAASGSLPLGVFAWDFAPIHLADVAGTLIRGLLNPQNSGSRAQLAPRFLHFCLKIFLPVLIQ